MENSIFIDYLSFTYKAEGSFLGSKEETTEFTHGFAMIDYFRNEFPEFSDLYESDVSLSKGFYDSVIIWNDNIRLSFNSDLQDPNFVNRDMRMGVNVDIPSHGLEWFFKVTGLCDSKDLILDTMKWLVDHHCRLSRIDITFDDFSKKYRPKYYYDKLYEHRLRTYFKTSRQADTVIPMEICGSDMSGMTFYLGSRKSDRFLRIYDKFLQSKGEIDAVRYEVEAHGKKAREFMESVLTNGVPSVSEWLTSFFVVLDSDSLNVTNKSMVSVDPDWYEWIISLNKDLTLNSYPKYSLAQRQVEASSWIENNVMNSLFGYVTVHGIDRLLEELHKKSYDDLPRRWKTLVDSKYINNTMEVSNEN